MSPPCCMQAKKSPFQLPSSFFSPNKATTCRYLQKLILLPFTSPFFARRSIIKLDISDVQFVDCISGRSFRTQIGHQRCPFGDCISRRAILSWSPNSFAFAVMKQGGRRVEIAERISLVRGWRSSFFNFLRTARSIIDHWQKYYSTRIFHGARKVFRIRAGGAPDERFFGLHSKTASVSLSYFGLRAKDPTHHWKVRVQYRVPVFLLSETFRDFLLACSSGIGICIRNCQGNVFWRVAYNLERGRVNGGFRDWTFMARRKSDLHV